MGTRRSLLPLIGLIAACVEPHVDLEPRAQDDASADEARALVVQDMGTAEQLEAIDVASHEPGTGGARTWGPSDCASPADPSSGVIGPGGGSCGCDANNMCVGQSFCNSQQCYSPATTISQLICGPGAVVNPNTCGVGCCSTGVYCTECGCLSPTQSEAICKELNPGCCWPTQGGATTQYGSFQRYYLSPSGQPGGSHWIGGIQTSTGDYAMAGYGLANTVLTDSLGRVRWATRGPMSVHTAVAAAWDGYVVAGLAAGSLAGVAKLNKLGGLKWYRQWGFSQPGDVASLPNGDVVVTGHFGSTSPDVFLLRTNTNGTVLWSQRYGTAGSETARSLIPTSDGGFLVVGATNGAGAGQTDLLVLRTDAWGTLEWAKTIGGAGAEGEATSAYEATYRAAPTAAGGAVISAWTTSWGAGSEDVLVVKIDGSGTVQWAKAAGGPGNDRGMVAGENSSGRLYVMGEATNSLNQFGIFAMQLDASGTMQWMKSLGPDQFINYMDGGAASDGGAFIITESHSPPAPPYHAFYLAKFSPLGTAGCCQTSDLPFAFAPVNVGAMDVNLAVNQGPAPTTVSGQSTLAGLVDHDRCP